MPIEQSWAGHLTLRSRLEELRKDLSKFLEVTDLVLRDLRRGCGHSRFNQMGGSPTHLGRTSCVDSGVVYD
jgi:hypothetical protein